MPIHIPTFPFDEYESVIVGPNTNECYVLKAIRAGEECTHADLTEALNLDSQAISGALYRLRQKDLVTYEDDTYALADATVATLADALIPLADFDERDGADVEESPETSEKADMEA